MGKLQHKLGTVALKHPNIVPGAMAKGIGPCGWHR